MNIVLIGVNQRRVESGHCHVVLVLRELNAYLLWEMYRKAYRPLYVFVARICKIDISLNTSS